MESIIGAFFSSNDDFQPYCLWKRDEALETLVIHLPGFKKDQLKVHITGTGILKISGERVVSETKRSHFRKELRVQSNWNADEIRAKFSAGHLRIMIPKKASPANGRDSSSSQQCQNNGRPSLEVTGQDEVTTKSSNYDQLGGAEAAVFPRRMVTTVKVVAAIVVLAAASIGFYTTFKYWISDEK